MLGRMREKTREWVRRYTHRAGIATKPTSLRMLWLARHPWRWDVLRTGCSDEEQEYHDYHDQGEDLGRLHTQNTPNDGPNRQ